MPKLWCLVAAVLLPAVAVLCVLGFTGVLDSRTTLVIGDGLALSGATAATVGFARYGRRESVPALRWRRWAAIAMAVLTLALASWSWNQLFAGIPIPVSAAGGAGFYAVPIVVFMAVLAMDDDTSLIRHCRSVSTSGRWARWFDAATVVVAMSLIVWVAVQQSDTVDGMNTVTPVLIATVLLALMYASIPALILMVYGPRQLLEHRALLLIACACVTEVVENLVVVCYLTQSARMYPAALSLVYATSPLLFALAAFIPDRGQRPRSRTAYSTADLVWLIVPHIPVVLAGVVVAIQIPARIAFTPIEIGLMLALVILLIMRQSVTLAYNHRLLHELSHHRELLEYQALHDPLTGLANRTLFLDRLNRALETSTVEPVTVLFIDIDDFKSVNDSHGHVVGDEVLHTIAQRLQSCARDIDTVARMGGDEYAMLLRHGDVHLEELRRQVQRACHARCRVRGIDVAITISVGAAHLSGRDRVSADELMHRADADMYAAKRRGLSGRRTRQVRAHPSP